MKINDWLSIQARGNVDFINDKFQQKMYAGTSTDISHANGRYIDLNSQEFMTYGDALAMFNKIWNNWSFNGALGGSINVTKYNSLRLDSGKSGLYKPNVFTIANMLLNTQGTSFIDETLNKKRAIQS